MFCGVGVSCRILYSIVSYLCVSYSGSITSVGEGGTIFCYRSLVVVWFLFEGVLFLFVLGVSFGFSL